MILLDNMSPEEITRILDSLRRENLWDAVIIEASGGISDANFEAYAASGVDTTDLNSDELRQDFAEVGACRS